jgi:hypothetical protein
MPLRDTLGELVKEIQGWLLNILRRNTGRTTLELV